MPSRRSIPGKSRDVPNRVQRAGSESSHRSQGATPFVDAIETTLPGLLTFRDNQLLLPYTSPHLDSYPEDSKEKGPKNLVYWTIDRESLTGRLRQEFLGSS